MHNDMFFSCANSFTEDNMLQIQNLSIISLKDQRIFLDHFNYTLNHSDKAVIIGEEGNGKSTLLKRIFDPALISSYAETKGSVIIQNEILRYLPQELPEEDHFKTIYEFFCAEECFFLCTPAELSGVSRLTGIPQERFYSQQLMHTLSGGEKVRIQLARLLCAKPSVLLLDEPTNDLDIETLQWLETFIRNTGAGVLYVSHDETFIENTANRIIHIELIKRKTESRWTTADIPYSEYLKRRNAALAHQEQMAESDRREDRIRMEKFRRIQARVEHEQKTVSRQDPHSGRLLKKKMKAVKSMEKRFAKQREKMTDFPVVEEASFFDFPASCEVNPGKRILDLQIPELHSPDGKLLSENIRLYVSGNEKICITGCNGCGKTTLLKKIYAELSERDDIRAGWMPQNYDELLDPQTDPVSFLAKDKDRDTVTKARQYLGSMRYTTDEMTHSCTELSGGQKAKLLLLKMILDECNVLILDEPARNFSPLSAPVFREVINRFRGAVIAVSHDRKYLKECAQTVYEMDREGLHRKQ